MSNDTLATRIVRIPPTQVNNMVIAGKVIEIANANKGILVDMRTEFTSYQFPTEYQARKAVRELLEAGVDCNSTLAITIQSKTPYSDSTIYKIAHLAKDNDVFGNPRICSWAQDASGSSSFSSFQEASIALKELLIRREASDERYAIQRVDSNTYLYL